jgi:hypothetical protein
MNYINEKSAGSEPADFFPPGVSCHFLMSDTNQVNGSFLLEK